MIYKFFDKKSKGSGIKFMSNQQLADELHNQLLENSKDVKSIVCLFFVCFKIWGADLADMQLISK